MIKKKGMQLNKNQKSLINKVIEGWERADLIDVDLANKLKGFDTVQEIDWAKVSKYSFWLEQDPGPQPTADRPRWRSRRQLFPVP